MKLRPVGAEFSNGDGRTDRQADMPVLIGSFRNSANAPNKTSLKTAKAAENFLCRLEDRVLDRESHEEIE
jgi:hypothetical protein